MTSYLITGDWQADSRNLGMINKAAQREREVMAEYGCTKWIDLGDLKNPYNPLDTRIALAMQDRVWDKEGLVLLGNHDRLSQNDDELSWFPLLDIPAQGSVRFVSTSHVIEHEDVMFYVLPYSGDVGVLRESAAHLAKLAADRRTSSTSREHVLLFHCDVSEADYGHGKIFIDSISIGDLQLSNYDYAFGGHVHKPQELIPGQAWYVGSPFCQDWGEANQQKRFLVYTPGVGVKSVPVGLPAFYDWDIAKNMTAEELTGCTVRLKLKVTDGGHFRSMARKRQEQFKAKYPETNLHLVPVYENVAVADYTFTQGNDEAKVREFVRQMKGDAKELADYVVKQLAQASSVKSTNTEGMRLLTVEAKNYTSFVESVKFDYRNRGIVLVNGKNLDWPGRSNGSGKTNFQDIPKTGLYGETGKGQSADDWANDQNEDKAVIVTQFQNAQGQIVKVVRTRRPHGVAVWVDGEDKSSGLTGREKTGGTQGLIQQLSGYDLSMLTNAVYIDQERAHKFLVGTRKEKSELLYKFQGLERFEMALKLVAVDVKSAKAEQESSDRAFTVATTKQQQFVITVESAQIQRTNAAGDLTLADEAYHCTKRRVRDLLSEYEQTETRLLDTRNVLSARKEELAETQRVIGSADTRIEWCLSRYEEADRAYTTASRELNSLRELVSAGATFRAAAVKEKAVRLTTESELVTEANELGKQDLIRKTRAQVLLTELGTLETGICPSCKRPFKNAADTARRAVEINAEGDRLNAEQKSVLERLGEIAQLLGRIRQQIIVQDRVIDAHDDKVRKLEARESAGPVAPNKADTDRQVDTERKTADTAKQTQISLAAEIATLEATVSACAVTEANYTSAYDAMQVAQRFQAATKQRYDNADAALTKLTVEQASIAADVKDAQARLGIAATNLSLYTRAVECLDRTGIPAYICGMLCPALTKSAEEYSRLFAGDALKVMFEFVDGEFDCKVINTQGASSIEALSTGERATAALVTAFALRSTAPKTNVLVLDEPGRGLDELGQRQFAEALSTLKHEFETILISTHDAQMSSALAADSVLTVVKQDRTSRIEGAD
jgi:DNA repair exonuclease SbcCD ATPase subunit/DNA repair exonuclease SbcCD nuclease subunit